MPVTRSRRRATMVAILLGAAVTSAASPAGASSRRVPATTSSDAPSTGRPLGIPGSWTAAFADEFQDGTLDTAKWSTGWFGHGITEPVGSGERECYDPAQVTQSEGQLHLRLVARSETCGGVRRPYASGLVSTNGRFSFTYGAAEARMYLPADAEDTVANWPAFWTDGQSWPADCENDIMEGLGGGVAYHYLTRSGTWFGGYAAHADSYTGWHTFATDWEPGSVTYYYDGVRVGAVGRSCSEPHYLILDNATSRGRSFAPADVRVDYVRVWRRAG